MWFVLRAGWRGCGFVGLGGCRRSAGWFGGWWAGVGDWFCWGCVWGERWGVGGSRCRWVVVDDVSVFGGGGWTGLLVGVGGLDVWSVCGRLFRY